MPVEIQHTQHPLNPSMHGLIAYDKDGQDIGYLNYVLSEGKPISLEGMKVVTPRRGIGKALLEELVRLIGPEQVITAVVIHEETLSYLESLGLFKEATGKRIDISGRKRLSTVPIVQFLKSGGISTTSLVISCAENPEVELNGITLGTSRA